MAITFIMAFAAVSFLFVITPGADWAYSISAGISYRSPVPAVAGMLTGHIAATIIVAVGVGLWISREPGLLAAMTVAGAIYLLWLGVNLVLRPSAISSDGKHATHSVRRQYLGGLAVSGMNPKVFLLFLALLPQFVDTSGTWPMSIQMLTLGSVQVVLTAIVYLIVGFLAMQLLRSRPTAAIVVSRLSGAVLIFVGVSLVAEQIL